MTTPPKPSPYNPATTFDALGAKYSIAFADIPLQQQSLNWLLHTLPQDRKCKCLDIGSGTGIPVASTLAAAGHSVLGLDISPEMIRLARENVDVPNARFEIADTRTWSPPAESSEGEGGSEGDSEGGYDAVTAYFSMIASFSQDDIRGLIGRIAGLLQPGGLFVFATVPVDGNEFEVNWMGYDVVVSSLSAEECTKVIRNAGFDVVEEHTQVFRPKAFEAGICGDKDKVWDEEHLFVFARKL